MTNAEYREREMRHVLDAGTHPEEDFFRLQVVGADKSRWVNITPAQLDAIAAVLGKPGPSDDALAAAGETY